MSRALLPLTTLVLATLVLLLGCERKEEIIPAPAPAPAPPRIASSLSPLSVRTKTHAPHLTPGTAREKAQVEAAKRQEAKAIATSIRNAIDQYHSDYDFLPAPTSATKDTDCESDTSAEEGLIAILKGADITRNSRSADYLGDLKEASEEKGRKLSGLVRDGDTSAIVDPWGFHYKVTLDLDMDKTVLNPAADDLLAGTEIVYSIGPDGDANTWEDNVISWDPEKSRVPKNTKSVLKDVIWPEP